jgi:hypothetical protein
MPGGELVTVPDPVPARPTVSRKVTVAKLALTFLAAVMVRMQVVVLPLQSPPQLTKLAPLSGVAVRVTLVPWS